MTGLQHLECIESLGKVAKELCRLDFTAFGSLYLSASSSPKGALPLDDRFCIGPHSGRQHWGADVDNLGRLNMSGNLQGPCKSEQFQTVHTVSLIHTRGEHSSLLHVSHQHCKCNCISPRIPATIHRSSPATSRSEPEHTKHNFGFPTNPRFLQTHVVPPRFSRPQHLCCR